MEAEAHHVSMVAILIMLAAVLVLLGSIPFGADSRRTEAPGRFRPNWF
jgi:predicted lysophospholipase L1 biosynthesis ABC-type transport system permease subunit